MKTILGNAILFTAIAGAVSMSLTHAAEDPTVATASRAAEAGRWITESGNLEVDIASCGQALCGTVVRVLGNRSMSHPGSAMQSADNRSPLGMKLLSDFVLSGGEWKGHIYNRENGETYDCLIELLAPDQLKVRAYKGLPLFGKTQVWRRAATASEAQGTSSVPSVPSAAGAAQ